MKINKKFIEIVKYTKEELKNYLHKELSKYYKEIINEDGFLFVKGKDKICLTAHMDTTPSVEYGTRKPVKKIKIKNKNNKTYISAKEGIGGDDRCGVFMIMQILETTSLRPSIVFCEDEEIGCVGSTKFSRSEYVNLLEDDYFVIELDRRGKNDIVFYDDDNKEFHEFVKETTGYEIAEGSCSDISEICPVCKRSGVNISCGYYNEHHYYEYVIYEEIMRTLETTINLIKKGIEKKEHFEYKEKEYERYYRYSYFYSNLDEKLNLWIQFVDEDGYEKEVEYQGDDEYEMWFDFFNDHPNASMSCIIDYYSYYEKKRYII